MSQKQQYRQLMEELGICDDRAEKALIDLFTEKDEQLELEKVRVDERVWNLENKLMEMEAANVTA